MEAIPLSREDRAILGLEGETIAGHTCKVVIIGAGAPRLAALQASVAERIERAEMLTRRLGGSQQLPAWVRDESFDPRNHIVGADLDRPVDLVGLRGVVARLFEERLNRERPLWQLDRVPLANGGAALVWRIHHAVADGITTMRFASALLWDPPSGVADESIGSGRREAAADELRRRGHLAAFLHREFARSRERSPFDGRIGTQRQIGFATAPLGALHDAAKRLADATLNDAVLATVTGALRRWLELHHGPLGDLRAKVPVSLHSPGDDAGNRDSFFTLALPLHVPDPVGRLRAIRSATTARKAEHDAQDMQALYRELGQASPRLEEFAERLERSPRRFALNVSNVPGPRGTVSVLGASVDELHSLAEIGERHALRVSVVSFAGKLCFGFCADPAIVEDLDALVDGAEAEAASLIGCAG
jgi:hypothetical protein